VVLAVPFAAIDAVVRDVGQSVGGKVVVDVTNALTPDMKLALGYSTTGAEELQKKLPMRAS
jgi:predicted dinucleotide-binding enzyme